jgi:hypothetical protein
MYCLSFYEAVEKCINGEGYIRGNKFKNGVYVKKQGETLIAIDAFNSNKVVGNLYIGTGIISQQYKLFNCIIEEELNDGYDDFAIVYPKVV